MKRVSRSQLDACADEYDAAVAQDPALDPFCSASPWLLAYHDAFAATRPLWLAHEGCDWVLLAEQHYEGVGPILEPLESLWGFGSPLVGEGAANLLAKALLARPVPILLLGLPADRARLAPLVDALAGRWAARPLEPTTRFVALLAGGLEGWFARRSRSFRRNLRSSLRRVRRAGISFRRVERPELADLSALYRRVLEVEARSWKSATGNGAAQEPMRSFYAALWSRLVARGQLRLLLAERDGEAVGYLHGARVGDHFRGLQFSFDDRERALGLGNALQLEMLRWLCEEGAHSYDLGTHSSYKRRWAEEGLTTHGLFLQPL